MGKEKDSGVRLVWHRRDLRLHDNFLYQGLSGRYDCTKKCVSLYIFDVKGYFTPQPSTCCPERYDSVFCGPHFARVCIEAVEALRASLHAIDGELLVRVTSDEVDSISIVTDIATRIGATEIFYSEEPGSYEACLSQRLKEYYCDKVDSSIHLHSDLGYTLFHPDDLPYGAQQWQQLAHPKQKHKKKRGPSNKESLNHLENVAADRRHDLNKFGLVNVTPQRFTGMCHIMGDFRRATRSYAQVREPLPSPKKLLKPNCIGNTVESGEIPRLQQLMTPLLSSLSSRSILGMEKDIIKSIVKSALDYNEKETSTSCEDGSKFHGGECHALDRLDYFVGRGYSNTARRNLADVGNNDSSKFSIHLSMGTLSPRTIYVKVRESGNIQSQWIISHLEMRDFFIYNAFKSGSHLFRQSGLNVFRKGKRKEISWMSPSEMSKEWKSWICGTSSLPLVDAAMKELLATGYCSNRVRQNVASVLTKDLKIDWRAGAEWFQFLLIDHCVGANWGNWLYFSGIGSDPKNRHFCTVSQALKYDYNAEYVKKWIPNLKSETNLEACFRPWDFSSEKLPFINPNSQYTYMDLERLKQTSSIFHKDENETQ